MAKKQSNESNQTEEAINLEVDTIQEVTVSKPKVPTQKVAKHKKGRRIVRLEPNPNRSVNLKLKMATAKVNSAGQAIQDTEGNIVKSESDVDGAIQVPGTVRFVKPALTPTGLKTGLNYVIDNPYKDLDFYNPSWGEKVLKGKDKVLLQHALEYKHGKDFDHYTNRLFDRVFASDKLAEIPFFATPQCQVPLDGNVIFLDMNNPLHEVWYYFLRDSSEVANSYEELNSSPEFMYYMVDDDEVYKVKADKKRRINSAAAALEDIYKMGGETIIQWAKALEIPGKNVNRDMAYEWLDAYFRVSDINYATFMKFHSMFKDVNMRERFYAYAEVHDLVQAGIIRERDNKYYWVMPETDDMPLRTFEWRSKENLIQDFLIAPEYAKEVEILRSIFDARK